MRIPLVDLKLQTQELKPRILEKLEGLLDSTAFILGNEVSALENDFAVLADTKYAISCNSGTDALVLILEASGIGSGDEVITTPFTFFATAESISRAGAVPVFVDVERDTFNIDPTKIEDAITPRTKAILPVHIFGQPANMEEIMRIAEKYGIKVIEDACQAVGASFTFSDGSTKQAGSIGDAAAFSFYPTKNLGGFGDGGMITVKSDKTAQIIKALRTHGGGLNGKKAYELMHGTIIEAIAAESGDSTVYDPTKYYNFLIGMNSRLDAMQAAILNVKIKKLSIWNDARIRLAKRYTDAFSVAGISGITPQREAIGAKSVYHLYVVVCEERDALAKFLAEREIATGIYYPVPLHLQKVYQMGKFSLGYRSGRLPVSEWLSQRTIALPLFPEMTEVQQDDVITAIKEFYKS